MWIAAKELVKPIALFGLILGAAGAADAEVIVHHFTASNEHGESISGWFSYPAAWWPSAVYDYTYDEPGWGGSEFWGGNNRDFAFMIDYNGYRFRSTRNHFPEYSPHFEYMTYTRYESEYRGGSLGLHANGVRSQDESLWGYLVFGLRSDDPTVIGDFRTLPRTLDLDLFQTRAISFSVEGDHGSNVAWGFSGTFDSITSTVIPEPASLVSCLVGSAMVGGWWLRRRGKAA